MRAPRRAEDCRQPRAEFFYCFSQTFTLLNVWPSGVEPLADIVKTFPSLETSNVVVSTGLPARLNVASRVRGATLFAEIESAPLGIAPVTG